MTFDGHRGATLNLRPEAPDLKRGARSIYVSRCVGALRTWLEMHPKGTNPKAPLFTAWRDRSGERRLGYQRWLNHLHVLARASGVGTGTGRSKALTPHDFRHTRATEAARSGWMEAELRAYFGWEPSSKMPARYVHLALGDMRQRVRRDAGVDDSGFTLAIEKGDKLAALGALMRDIMQAPGALSQYAPKTAVPPPQAPAIIRPQR